MKKTNFSRPYLNDSNLDIYRGFGMKYPKLYENFKRKIIAHIIARIWYIRLQKAKQHKLACFWGSTIQSMESIYKEWRLKGGI